MSKRGRGGDSQDALREIWMQGYREGIRVGGVPVVKVKPQDIARVYEHGACGNSECPVCGSQADR